MRLATRKQKMLAWVLAMGSLPAAMHAQDGFRAGAGNAVIEIPAAAFPTSDGFTASHDALHAKVILFDDGKKRVGILVVDQTSITEESIARMKEILQQHAKVAAEDSLVIASHTFSSPHVIASFAHSDAERARLAVLRQSIEGAVADAAQRAAQNLQPAKMGYGQGASNVNVSRDVETPRGWWLGADAAGYADHSVHVLRVDGSDGKPISMLVNYAVQSSIMDHSTMQAGGFETSADLQGEAMRYIEHYYGDKATSLFLIGAAGDQAPLLMANRYVQGADGNTTRVDLHDAGFTLVQAEGERLGADVVRVADVISASAGGSIEILRSSFEVDGQKKERGLPNAPLKNYTFEKEGKVSVPVVVLRVGDLALVGVRGELSARLGAEIRTRSPFKNTMVVTLVDGGAKYMPDASSYDRITYEARNSGYARGAAEETVTHILQMLQSVKH